MYPKNSQKIFKENAHIGCLQKFGFSSIYQYFQYLKRVDFMLKKQVDFKNRQYLILILLANKILILKNIQHKFRQIKTKKLQEEQLTSLFDLQTLKEIQNKSYDYIQIKVQCQKILSQQQRQNHKQICKFIDKLKMKEFNVFRKNQLIFFQRILRKFIIKCISEENILKEKWTEEKVALRDKIFVLLDFLISILQFNAIFIQHNNSWMKFKEESKIDQIHNRPLQMNLKILQKIITKINLLNLTSKFDQQKK